MSVGGLLNELNRTEFGEPIQVRGYSFLDSPDYPREMKVWVARLGDCNPAVGACRQRSAAVPAMKAGRGGAHSAMPLQVVS